MSEHEVILRVNGQPCVATIQARTTLAEFIRERCHLTGTHLACEHGVCGACTVLVDGEATRSCLVYAVQVQPSQEVTTIEGLSPADGSLSDLQQAFRQYHGLQCGFCTPGFIVTAHAFLATAVQPSIDDIREALSGNLCRCTGYQGIVEAVASVAGVTVHRSSKDASS